MFYKESRGRNYFRTGKDEGRYLSAGFHNVMGYTRDDTPLKELILDEKGQKAEWQVEMGTGAQLARNNLTVETLKPGTMIKVSGQPSRAEGSKGMCCIKTLMKADGSENPFKIWQELGEEMTKNCTVIRYNKNLQETDAKLVELLERFQHINLSDRSQWANTTVAFARQLYNMLQLSRVIAQGAAMRDESRGSHYKPDFPERDDKNWMKTTKATFAPDADLPPAAFTADTLCATFFWYSNAAGRM